MIGNFDNGQDPWTGAQRTTAIRIIAKIQASFGLPPSAFRFHNEMSSKTCPGSALHRSDLLEAVAAAHNQLVSERSLRPEERAAESEQRATVDRILRLFGAGTRSPAVAQGDSELPERDMTLRQSEMSAGSEGAFETSRAGDTSPLTPGDFALLRRHVINLRMGALSSGGTFQTTKDDVVALFTEHLPRFLEERRQQSPPMPLKLVFYAHGGLNDETESLRNARNRIPFYLANHCYPVFFVWETGLRETLVDIVRQLAGFSAGRAVGIVSGVSDPLLEGAFRPAGFSMWLNMKRSAELAFLPKQGGTLLVEQVAAFWKQHSAELELHGIGHSAGTIFLAHLVNALCQQPSNPPIAIRTLQFLAPAITIDLFKELVADLVGTRVGRFTEYTMQRDFEQGDAVGPYRKSLLYLVSRSFEDESEMGLLGLEESLRRDPEMTRFFGLLGPGQKRRGEVLFSKREDGPSHSTIAIKHGDFDNDRFTMAGVIRRVLDIKDDQPIVEFPESVSRTVLDEARAVTIDLPPASAPLPASVPIALTPPAAPAVLAGAQGRRRALCVGIDDYDPPYRLAGCVNDANDWAAMLRSLGFDVTMLINRDASWQRLQDALGALITASRAGDVIVFQYAGHGTRVNDVDGDEESGRDSALCPADFASGRLLIDDDVRRIVAPLASGVNFTCFFDCCHSGTITRLAAPSPETPRGDVRTRGLRASPEVEAAHAAFRRSLPETVPAGRAPSDMKEVSFTACNDAQTAQEIDGHGQFTVRALSLLRQGLGAMTNRDFHQRVTAAFGSTAATQTPGLDCSPLSLSLPLFGGSAAVAAAAQATPDLRDVMARLDALERRISRAGV
jgi:hypothetical protein